MFYEAASAAGNAVLDDVVTNFTSQIDLWIRGLGVIAVIILIYSATMFMINRKQANDLKKIKREIEKIDGKLDKLLKKRR